MLKKSVVLILKWMRKAKSPQALSITPFQRGVNDWESKFCTGSPYANGTQEHQEWSAGWESMVTWFCAAMNKKPTATWQNRA